MSEYHIHTLWAWRKNEEGPELLEAWDAFSVDTNYEGWREACVKALAAMDDDISELGSRHIIVKVSGIEELFYDVELEGEVVGQ